MKLGISTFSYGWAVGDAVARGERDAVLTWLLGQAAAVGAEVLQIGDNLPLHEFDEAQLESLAAAAQEHGVELEVGARRMTAELLERYVEISRALGSRLLRFVVDEGEFEPSPEEIVGVVARCRDLLGEAGVTLGIENHDRFKVRTLADIVRHLDDPRVGVCLDTANSLGSGEGIAEVLEVLAPLAVNLHVKDFTVRRAVPHGMGFVVEGAPTGEGMLDVPEVIRAVAAHGRCETVVLEVWTPQEADLTSTIRKEAAWAESGARTLRTLLNSTF